LAEAKSKNSLSSFVNNGKYSTAFAVLQFNICFIKDVVYGNFVLSVRVLFQKYRCGLPEVHTVINLYNKSLIIVRK